MMPPFALVTYPRPSAERLSGAQQEIYRSIVTALEATNFDGAAIEAKLPDLVARMTAMCASAGDRERMVTQIGDWVRWHRFAGYYLARIFQASMAALGSFDFITASVLLSDAQHHFAEDDLALISLENAYVAWQRADAAPAVPAIGRYLRKKLWETYSYYRQWYSPAAYANINQLAEHPVFDRAWNDLQQAFPELRSPDAHKDAAALQSVIERCSRPDDMYCRVVALRTFGLAQFGAGNVAASEGAYREALAAAQSVSLDAEIGHLHRLLGFVLMRQGRLDEAESEHRKALDHDSHPRLGYWQALTLGELGDVGVRRIRGPINPTEPSPERANAAKAYAASRQAFERAVSRDVLPVSRAVKQQMMRSYADNAVQIAAAWRDELLAAIEVFGPRSANDLVAEGHAAAALDAPKYGLFREARAIVHRGLATLATNTDAGTAFEAYLADVVAHQPERRYYLQARNALGSQIAGAQRSGEAVSRALALRMPKTALLLVNVERAQMHVVLVDAATGTPLVVLNARPPEGAGWQVAHDAYDAALRQADTPGEDPAPGMQAAIDAVLAYYEPAFAPLLELLATRLEGYRLKIFPRFLMNRVPLHALRVRGKPLIDCCDVSYAPSLSLFLQVHQEDAAPAAGTLTILHDAARTQAYAGTMRALRSEAPESVVTVNGPTWQNFRASLEVRPASDILFACHGRFDGDNPSKSRLEVTRREFIDFAKISVDLDLRGCRSVFMGACESGLGRTLVSAEYIGLPLVFLAAGVRYVIGTLWQVTQLPAAILVAIHYTLLLDEARPVVNCLNEAARRLKSMSRDDVMAWVRRFLPEKAAEVEAQISALPDPPFAHPYYWAGFYVSGDA